jgi:MFS family permease
VITIAFHLPDHQYSILLLGRVITGLSAGLAMVPATVYVVEITSQKLRSALSTWPAVFFSFGILLVYILGYLFKVYLIQFQSINKLI